MAASAWSVFLPEVLVDVAGCPVPIVTNAIQNAVIDFLTRSRIQVVELAPVDVVAEEAVYVLTPPDDHRIIGAEDVAVDGEELAPLTDAQAAALYPDWKTQTGDVVAFTNPTPDTLRLVRVPSTAITGGLVASVAVAPLKTAAGPEAWIAQKYLEQIAAGAKHRLLLRPGRPWSNPELGVFFAGVFETGVADAANSKQLGAARDARRRTKGYYR